MGLRYDSRPDKQSERLYRRSSAPANLSVYGQWPSGENSALFSDVWFARKDSFPQFRMTPGPEMVLKQGFLYKKRERSLSASLRRPWQSGYFVLKKSPSYSGLLLDEYRDASLRIAKQTLFLDTVKHVGPVNTSRSKQYAFQVVVLGRSPLFFACDNELLRSEWIGIFSRCTEEVTEQAFSRGRISPEGGPSARQIRSTQSTSAYIDIKSEESNGMLAMTEIKGYEVWIQKTPLSEGNNLQGSYLLGITKTRIFLKQVDGKEYVLSWPLTQLRGFKCQPEQQQVVLETGRRCHFGKGRLGLKTRHAESIIRDIREAISSDSLTSDNSSESETETNSHRSVSRCSSEQPCQVTVSVRPRRIHSERFINQVAVGRAANGSLASGVKVASFNSVVSSSAIDSMTGSQQGSVMDGSAEEVFDFEDRQGLPKEAPKSTETLQKAANWKTSLTFGKKMLESRSDNENSSNDCEEEADGHSYVDIIHDEKDEKPFTADEASTLLAQVVADLEEPQKRNCFVKSNSTGGIQGKPSEISEVRRASEPAVGSRGIITSSVSDIDPAGNPCNTQWKLRLEKINEVSFTEATDGDQHSSPKSLSPKSSCSDNDTKMNENDRPKSLSEILANELEMPTLVKPGKQRSKTLLGITQSHIGSSLTDLSTSKHKGLKAALSLSPSSKFSYQLERDTFFFGFAPGAGKVPSFPKSSVVKAVESVGSIENSRAKLSMSPLPPEFHANNVTESFDINAEKPNTISPTSTAFNDILPPRPPKGTAIKANKSKPNSKFSPPPLPARSPSLPAFSTREKLARPKSSSLLEATNTSRPYANTPPKVNPRIPNAMPLNSLAIDATPDDTLPPPRPPKPESLSAALRKTAADRRMVLEKRTEAYPWESDRHMGIDLFKDESPTLDRVKKPIVTVTPPRSPDFQRPPKGFMRGISLSDSDLTEASINNLQMRAALSSTRSSPNS